MFHNIGIITIDHPRLLMANKKTQKAKRSLPGPLLAVAVFCEQTVEDVDKSVSIIKLADTVTFNLSAETPADIPSKEKPIPLGLRGLISFRRGGATGKWHRMKLTMVAPTGEKKVIADRKVELQPQPWASVNSRIEVTMGVFQAGVFWLIVEFDAREYTRVPLHIVINRAQPSPGGRAKKKSTS